MARYRKIDPRLWRDEKFRRLSRDEKLIAIYIITAQSNRIGIFSFSPALACEELDMVPATFRERFQTVTSTLGWCFDEAARVLFLPTWWRYNPPENANNVIGSLKDLDDVPDSPLISVFCTTVEHLSETLHRTFREHVQKRYRNVPGTLPLTLPNSGAVTVTGAGTVTGEKLLSTAFGAGWVNFWIDYRLEATFAKFWELYPRKVKRKLARKTWQRLEPDPELFARIMAKLKRDIEREWKTREPDKIPHGSTWLSDERWNDEPPGTKPATPAHPYAGLPVYGATCPRCGESHRIKPDPEPCPMAENQAGAA